MLPELKEVQVFSDFLFYIREFFRKKGFLEIETPLLNPFATTEPYIDSFQILSNQNLYLITSPEFNLKTLLSYYKKNIFQIAHVFRKGDESKLHNPEFLMLEWYHLYIDEFQLIDEIKELLTYLTEKIRDFEQIKKFNFVTIEELFKKNFNCDLSKKSLIHIVQEYNLVEKKNFIHLEKESYDNLFFIVFLSLIEPKLETDNPLFLYGYPSYLRAYSKLNNTNKKISRRFELYWKNMEIANGYYEITDKKEQLLQILKERKIRMKLNKIIPPISNSFINSFPLPECSGVSIGLERLFIAFRNLNSISQISFSGKLN